nr:MAG TPA: hypothetical protein [Caudoviricetes sp.]
MGTDYEDCFYDDETIRGMMKAGLKAYKDGKVYRPKNGDAKHGKDRGQNFKQLELCI